MMVMSPSPMNAPSIVSPSSMLRQITSATGQEEQVDFMLSLGCENGGLEHLHFPPKAHLHPDLTTPRKHTLTHSRNGTSCSFHSFAQYHSLPLRLWQPSRSLSSLNRQIQTSEISDLANGDFEISRMCSSISTAASSEFCFLIASRILACACTALG